jgi:DNA-binding MarR family transcriptional regulator
MTVTQYGLLGHLAKFDGIGIGALAGKLIMDPTTLTRNLRPLERQGFVVAKPDRRDKRSRCLHLTASGRAAFETAKPAWVRAQRQIEQALGGAETSALNAALDRVLENDLLDEPPDDSLGLRGRAAGPGALELDRHAGPIAGRT